MFFREINEIGRIARNSGTSVFVVPDDEVVKIPGAFVLEPEEKSTITVEQVRSLTSKLGLKQLVDQFVVVRPADKMGSEAANAFLKNLEEPGEKIHYILITDSPTKLLPTILSRAAIYFLFKAPTLELESTSNEKKKELAKRLIVADGEKLVKIADEIAKTSGTGEARKKALETLTIAIEMAQKSYYITKKEAFLRKIPKLLNAYEKIAANGHVKLQIVANLC